MSKPVIFCIFHLFFLVTGPQQIISLGQFRPEKDHPLQIRALAKVRDAIFNDSTKSEEEKDQVWEQVGFCWTLCIH